MTASLVFDAQRLDANLRAISAAARAHRITTLFAAKSFPHPRVRELAAQHLDGFDAASVGEIRDLVSFDSSRRVLSVVDPSGAAARSDLVASWRGRLVVGVETLDQVAAVPERADIAIRMSASFGDRDPAVGAILDGTGRRRSRFGLDLDPEVRRDQVRTIRAAASGRRVGVHLHHGLVVATTAERFVASMRDALAGFDDVEPAFIDLGGAWHGIGIAGIEAAFAVIRAAVPSTIEILVEPGRVIASGAGTATGRVMVARRLDDRELRVTELSRVCHLRWSQLSLIAKAPAVGRGVPTTWVGPTCYEDDVLGDWVVDPDEFPVGAKVTVGGVTGYAVAWNTGFGGVPPAEVIVA